MVILGFMLNYALRVNLTIAIVAMVQDPTPTATISPILFNATALNTNQTTSNSAELVSFSYFFCTRCWNNRKLISWFVIIPAAHSNRNRIWSIQMGSNHQKHNSGLFLLVCASFFSSSIPLFIFDSFQGLHTHWAARRTFGRNHRRTSRVWPQHVMG